MRHKFKKVNEVIIEKAIAARVAVSNNRGEGYIDIAVFS